MAVANQDQHIFQISPLNKSITISHKNIILGSSNNALILTEKKCQPVIYIPSDDINFKHLMESDFVSYCPHKGDANYWHLVRNGGVILDNIAWQYQNPIDDAKEIKNYFCFYKDKVSTIIE
jgi:uncharacterized protein (DUF427 family)